MFSDDHVMEPGSLTLQETADRLDVHYMTVYRWVHTGLLPAVKDDGVWRVRPEDADARAQPVPEPDAEPRPRRRIDHGARLGDCLLAGDEGGAIRVVDDALAGGVSAEDLSLDVITRAMRTIGEAWAAGDATIAEEHRASVIAARLVGRLSPQFTRRGRKRGTIVLGTVSGDHHGLPVSAPCGAGATR
jgi:excisionase family DNA binding protein